MGLLTTCTIAEYAGLPLTVTVAVSVVSLAGGATVAIVICVGSTTVTAPNATTAPLGVVTVTVLTGQAAVAAEVVVKPVPVMVTGVCFPVGQTLGDMELIVGTEQGGGGGAG
ncbi:MAG: hypothetical protein WCA89_18160 [Terracidiphilus sp.]